MALGSLFKRKPASAADAGVAAPEDDGPVQQARVRARRRLIGAVVLLALGVVLFPLLFETQPRPLPRDIPIELARRDGATSPARPVDAPVAPVRSAPAPRPAPPVVTLPGDAGSEQPATPASAASAAAVAAVVAASVPAALPAASPPPRAQPAAAKAAAAAAASEPDATASAPKVVRWVVQVGAFTDAAALREARQKVEKLGMKTYTQVVETDAGRRTRVRVGPFETREEAERMGVKLKAAGMPAFILGL